MRLDVLISSENENKAQTLYPTGIPPSVDLKFDTTTEAIFVAERNLANHCEYWHRGCEYKILYEFFSFPNVVLKMRSKGRRDLHYSVKAKRLWAIYN